MTELLVLDHKTVLASLERRKTVAGLVYRSLAVSGVLLACAELGYVAFREYRDKEYRLEQHAIADSFHREQSRAHATADSLTALVSFLRQTVRKEELALQQTRDQRPLPERTTTQVPSCGVPQVLEQNGYSAVRDRCSLKVTIPVGGSISGASLAYFGDAHRWKQDRVKNALVDPNAVEPGYSYTFTLP